MLDGEEAAGGTEEQVTLSEQTAAEEVVEAEVVEGEAGGGAGGSDDDAAIEAEARSMGWVPPEEWKGEKKPARMKTAKEFVEDGRNILPIVNAENKRLKAELEATKKETADRFAKMERMHEIARKKEREQIEARYNSQIREAVKLGDEEGFDAAEKAKAKALKELDEQEAPEEGAETKSGALTPTQMAAYTEWHADNSWFGADETLTEAMDMAMIGIKRQMPAATFKAQLEAARKKVAGLYPEQFGETEEKPSRKSAVEGGSRVLGGAQKSKLSSKLGAEEIKQADKDVKAGLYKDREDWARVYFGEEE